MRGVAGRHPVVHLIDFFDVHEFDTARNLALGTEVEKFLGLFNASYARG